MGTKAKLGFCLIALGLGTSGCSSTDSRFEKACAEQKSEGWPYPEAEKVCQYGDYATEEQKKAFVDMYEDVKAAKERVEALR